MFFGGLAVTQGQALSLMYIQARPGAHSEAQMGCVNTCLEMNLISEDKKRGSSFLGFRFFAPGMLI